MALLQPSLAAAPQVVQYQGRLTDSNGRPLEGTVDRLIFRLYGTAAPTSSSFVWGEAHRDVPVRRGVFTVYLGAGAETIAADGSVVSPQPNPLTSQQFTDEVRYVQVEVDDDQTASLSPLVQLSSVPYALSAPGTVPVGTVIDWYRPSVTDPVPAGWEICDGSRVQDSQSAMHDKPKPDLRGRFVVGLADPAGTIASNNYGADAADHGGHPQPVQGGSQSHDLSHRHFIGDHDHGLGSHTHTMPHTHAVSGRTGLGDQNNLPGGPSNALYQGGIFMHVHPVNLTSGGPSTTTTGAASGRTDRSGGGETGGALGVVDNRPPYVGLLKIIRVR